METCITREKLSFDKAFESVRAPGSGAAVLFIGTVRDSEEGRKVSAINYEAYDQMALSELAKGALKAEDKHGAKLAVFHRLGAVPVGEASIVVAAAAPHREAAFAACREIVEHLKENVPIWKTAFIPAEDKAS
jgi:molybdopterin synthase catalytic subunit